MNKVIIESREDLSNFRNLYENNESIIFFVYEDNKLILLFFYLKNCGYYLLPINLYDVENISDISFLEISEKNKLILDKGDFSKLGIEIKNSYDLNSLFYLTNLDLEISELDYNLFLNRSLLNLNKVNRMLGFISVYCYFDYFENLLDKMDKDKVMSLLNSNINEVKNFDRFVKSFNEIENNGLCIDKDLFKKYFKKELDKDLVYSKYNLYNFTGRPSNTCEGVNLNSLKKKNKERSFLISRFGNKGKLLLLDYDAYHYRLVSKLINYKLPFDQYTYEYLGKRYFRMDEINSEGYNKVKENLFKILYSKKISEYSNIDFFKDTLDFLDILFKEYKEKGYVESVIFKRKLYFNKVEKMNKHLLFNYYIQNYETENNLIVIEKINEYLKNKESKLVMYNYDSYLIDYKEEENILNDLKNIIEENDFLTKVYIGNNFNDLERINNK